MRIHSDSWASDELQLFKAWKVKVWWLAGGGWWRRWLHSRDVSRCKRLKPWKKTQLLSHAALPLPRLLEVGQTPSSRHVPRCILLEGHDRGTILLLHFHGIQQLAECNFQADGRNHSIIHLGWWFQPSEQYEFVNWDDEIPNTWNITSHVPNHQHHYFHDYKSTIHPPLYHYKSL